MKKGILLVGCALVLCSCTTSPKTTNAAHTVKTAPSGTLESMVNTVISDLKTNTTLTLLNGHVAINISSGNKELDKKFAGALQNAFPHFASGVDTVNREDLYQMTIKIYRENDDVVVGTMVRNFEQRAIVERTITIQQVSPNIVETLQYRTAIIAKNEFDAHLDTAFGNAGPVVAEARVMPPQQPPPPPQQPPPPPQPSPSQPSPKPPKPPQKQIDAGIYTGIGGHFLSAISTNYGLEVIGLYPEVGLYMGKLWLSVFGGAGYSIYARLDHLQNYDLYMGFFTYIFGGELGLGPVGIGAGMIDGTGARMGDDFNFSELGNSLYPFARFIIRIDVDDSMIKFYSDFYYNNFRFYNFDNIIGFKLGVLFLAYTKF